MVIVARSYIAVSEITKSKASATHFPRPVLSSYVKWFDFEMKHRLLVHVPDENQAETVKGSIELEDALVS